MEYSNYNKLGSDDDDAAFDMPFERALVIISVISILCSVLMLYKLKRSAWWGFRAMVRAITVLTCAHLLDATLSVVQLSPMAFLTGQLPPWHSPPGNIFCKIIAITVQVAVVSDFVWSSVFIGLFMMLMMGLSAEQLDRSAPLHISAAIFVTAFTTLLPFRDQGYGYIPEDYQCWILSPSYRVTLYAIFLTAFAFAITAACMAVRRRHVFQRSPVLFKMGLFVVYFTAFWALPCARRIIFYVWNYSLDGVWVNIIRVLNASNGVGSFLLWSYIVRPSSSPAATATLEKKHRHQKANQKVNKNKQNNKNNLNNDNNHQFHPNIGLSPSSSSTISPSASRSFVGFLFDLFRKKSNRVINNANDPKRSNNKTRPLGREQQQPLLYESNHHQSSKGSGKIPSQQNQENSNPHNNQNNNYPDVGLSPPPGIVTFGRRENDEDDENDTYSTTITIGDTTALPTREYMEKKLRVWDL